jgi:hypothetical protein
MRALPTDLVNGEPIELSCDPDEKWRFWVSGIGERLLPTLLRFLTKIHFVHRGLETARPCPPADESDGQVLECLQPLAMRGCSRRIYLPPIKSWRTDMANGGFT